MDFDKVIDKAERRDALFSSTPEARPGLLLMISFRITALLGDLIASSALAFVNPICVNSDTTSAFVGSALDIVTAFSRA